MSKKDRRKELEEQKASEGKVVVLKEKAEEKKEVAEVVKAAEKKVKEESKVKVEEKVTAEEMTIADLAKWSSNQSQLIAEICKKLSDHDHRLEALENDVSEMKEYFEEEDDYDEEEDDSLNEKEQEEPEEKNDSPELCLNPMGPNDGPGYAYRYWDAKTRTYGITKDIFAAKQISKGAYDPIWVWFKDGKIDHILSIEELRKCAPR